MLTVQHGQASLSRGGVRVPSPWRQVNLCNFLNQWKDTVIDKLVIKGNMASACLSLSFFLSLHLPLEPSHHVVLKPTAHGVAMWGSSSWLYQLGPQPTALCWSQPPVLMISSWGPRHGKRENLSSPCPVSIADPQKQGDIVKVFLFWAISNQHTTLFLPLSSN